MSEKANRRKWEKIRKAGEALNDEIKAFRELLDAEISCKTEFDDVDVWIKEVRENVETSAVYVSDYQPYGKLSRYININLPTSFAKRLQCGACVHSVNAQELPIILLKLTDFQKGMRKFCDESKKREISFIFFTEITKDIVKATDRLKYKILEFAEKNI